MRLRFSEEVDLERLFCISWSGLSSIYNSGGEVENDTEVGF
jgi:hypothetical protein